MTHYGDADEAFFRRTDAMLEGVFDERDEDQRCDFQRSVTGVEIHADAYALGQADAHERDVVADEIQFLLQGHERLLIVVKHMTQEPAQFQHRILCLFGIEGYQGIDVVQRVEQEMRIELIFEILEFGIRLLLFDFDEPFFGLSPADADAYGCTEADNEGHHYQIATHKHPSAKHHGRRWHVRSVHHHRWVGKEQRVTETDKQHHTYNQDCILQEEPEGFLLEQIAGDQVKIIDVEGEETTEGHNAMPQVFCPIDLASPFGKHEGETENKKPNDGVYGDFQWCSSKR